MKRILYCLLICFLSLNACDNSTSTNNSKNSTAKIEEQKSWIIGKWKDDNSVIEYRDDGTFVGTWNKKITKEGTWKIVGDQIIQTLAMKFNDGLAANYDIIGKSENEFKIQSKTDKAIFAKTRVK